MKARVITEAQKLARARETELTIQYWAGRLVRRLESDLRKAAQR
jgi:hypothetical protein